MKKLFALVLAVAMVLSMASIAMAETAEANTQIGTVDKTAGFDVKDAVYTSAKNPVDMTNEKIPYGKTVYVALTDENGVQFTKADEVDGLKVAAKWDHNGEYVKSVEIAKKEGAYWVVIKTTGTSMDDNDVEGTLTFTGKVYADAAADKKTKIEKTEVDVVLTLGYEELNNSTVIPEDPAIFVFDEEDAMSDEELELTVEKDDDVTFTVDTTHQSDIVLAFETDAIDEVEDAYPSANLDFYVFNGATFKKTGELFIPADEGSYLYEVVDGAVKAVDAEYDDYDEGFYLKTKTLGAYVVSDVKLATAAATETTGTTTNPTTGAAL